MACNSGEEFGRKLCSSEHGLRDSTMYYSSITQDVC